MCFAFNHFNVFFYHIQFSCSIYALKEIDLTALQLHNVILWKTLSFLHQTLSVIADLSATKKTGASTSLFEIY